MISLYNPFDFKQDPIHNARLAFLEGLFSGTEKSDARMSKTLKALLNQDLSNDVECKKILSLEGAILSEDQNSNGGASETLKTLLKQILSLDHPNHEVIENVRLVVKTLRWLDRLIESQVSQTTEVFGRDYSGTSDSVLLGTLWGAWNGARDAFCRTYPFFKEEYNVLVEGILSGFEKQLQEMRNLHPAVVLQIAACPVLADHKAYSLFLVWEEMRSL